MEITMLNVGKIEEGFVLDHIKAGKSLSIYEHLQLDKLDCTVAIIKNARSGKMSAAHTARRAAPSSGACGLPPFLHPG